MHVDPSRYMIIYFFCIKKIKYLFYSLELPGHKICFCFSQVFQEFSEAMNRLNLELMELLGISMGLKDRTFFRRFFEDGNAIFRCNYYPPCKQPEKALGVGPHNDPTAITVLLQDDVVGLEVFASGKWQTVRPRPGALVVNVGDTFMVRFYLINTTTQFSHQFKNIRDNLSKKKFLTLTSSSKQKKLWKTTYLNILPKNIFSQVHAKTRGLRKMGYLLTTCGRN